MSLTVYTGNRMENLADTLADTLRLPLPSPLTPEFIVVQSAGMQRWLDMELSARFGVWANCRYRLPNAMVWELSKKVIPGLPEVSPFVPGTLTWRIMGLLPMLMARPGFEPVSRYLAGESANLKRFQLAERIADTFDQYTVFRPAMLREWENGTDNGWQADLWRELVKDCGSMHRGWVLGEFVRRMAPSMQIDAILPSRISVFGISYLPPFHMDILAATAGQTEVNLFLLNPCREYWGSIFSEKEQSRLRRKADPGASASDYFEAGNPLLASLGRMGRDFFDGILERFETLIRDDFTEEKGIRLLEFIRNDILTLADVTETRLLDPDDRSLRVHSCHGPMREIEVLHDTLLDMFERDPTLTPRDILVMTPDIDAYAPYITAVFDAPRDPAMHIPYSIADRSLMSEGHAGQGLLEILSLCGGRYGVNHVLDILELPPVRKRFAIEIVDLDKIRFWLEKTCVRWGRDEKDRIQHGAPEFRENSWRAGLDRLLLGYVLGGEEERLFSGILPFDEMEGDDARVLGSLLRFVNRLFAVVDSLERPRTLSEWDADCRALLGDFFDVDEEEQEERLAVIGTLGELREQGEQSGFAEPVEAELIRNWIEARLKKSTRGATGFLTGKVTFSAMLPMRSIPFRVIALIGMNDGAFPRRNRPPEFDLTFRDPKRGDRSLRDEDRYLFLETLLSARDMLHISYVGQGMKDNAEIPPSVLVSELLDYADRGFAVEGREAPLRDHLIVRHRLQPFSPAYFTCGSGLYSYSEENRTAAESLLAGGSQRKPFLTAPLPPPADEARSVSLDELASFYINPARYFLKKRFGIMLQDPEGGGEESEPFRLAPLDRYAMEQELTGGIMRGKTPEELLPVYRARGSLPAGRYGDEVFAELAEGVRDFADTVLQHLDDLPMPPLDVDLRIGDFRLTGRLDQVWQSGLLRYRCAKLKPKDRLRIWIEHLVLNGLAPEGYPAESRLLGKDGNIAFSRVVEWREILSRLLETYRQGMMEPLHFFPAASFVYAEKVSNPKTAATACRTAFREWQGSDAFPGEKRDPAYRLCFGAIDPLDDVFRSLATAIWAPVLRHSSV